MFVLMAALWAIVFLIWVVISAPQWKVLENYEELSSNVSFNQNMTAIHYILLTYPVCKVVLCAYSAEYFHSYQVAGKYLYIVSICHILTFATKGTLHLHPGFFIEFLLL